MPPKKKVGRPRKTAAVKKQVAVKKDPIKQATLHVQHKSKTATHRHRMNKIGIYEVFTDNHGMPGNRLGVFNGNPTTIFNYLRMDGLIAPTGSVKIHFHPLKVTNVLLDAGVHASLVVHTQPYTGAKL